MIPMKNMINLPRIYDPRGSLTVVENLKSLPFKIGRVKLLSGMTPEHVVEENSTAHAIFAVPLSGSFCIETEQNNEKETSFLNRPYQGILIEASTPYRLYDFTYGAVCLLIEAL